MREANCFTASRVFQPMVQKFHTCDQRQEIIYLVREANSSTAYILTNDMTRDPLPRTWGQQLHTIHSLNSDQWQEITFLILEANGYTASILTSGRGSPTSRVRPIINQLLFMMLLHTIWTKSWPDQKYNIFRKPFFCSACLGWMRSGFKFFHLFVTRLMFYD